jgi:hypothetical protein
MICFEIVDWGRQQYMLYADEPFRMESINTDYGPIVHVYLGIQIDLDQEPVGVMVFCMNQYEHTRWWLYKDGEFTSDKVSR